MGDSTPFYGRGHLGDMGKDKRDKLIQINYTFIGVGQLGW